MFNVKLFRQVKFPREKIASQVLSFDHDKIQL